MGQEGQVRVGAVNYKTACVFFFFLIPVCPHDDSRKKHGYFNGCIAATIQEVIHSHDSVR